MLNSAGLAGNCFNTSKMRKFSAINKENKDINNYAGIQPSVKVFSLPYCEGVSTWYTVFREVIRVVPRTMSGVMGDKISRH